jgi:hypothetical protein
MVSAHVINRGPRQTIRHQARRNGEDEKGKRKRSLKKSGFTSPCTEQQHRYDRRGSQSDLLADASACVSRNQSSD